jgi:hypothetical protein
MAGTKIWMLHGAGVRPFVVQSHQGLILCGRGLLRFVRVFLVSHSDTGAGTVFGARCSVLCRSDPSLPVRGAIFLLLDFVWQQHRVWG